MGFCIEVLRPRSYPINTRLGNNFRLWYFHSRRRKFWSFQEGNMLIDELKRRVAEIE